ncbi:MAG: hypothetical protein IJV99_02525 [Clostridia bacterium]|nr:hypothetical protein [Clostridia bacterium]
MLKLQRKGYEEKGVFIKVFREMAVGASHNGGNFVVVSELKGRKQFASRTFP